MGNQTSPALLTEAGALAFQGDMETIRDEAAASADLAADLAAGTGPIDVGEESLVAHSAREYAEIAGAAAEGVLPIMFQADDAAEETLPEAGGLAGTSWFEVVASPERRAFLVEFADGAFFAGMQFGLVFKRAAGGTGDYRFVVEDVDAHADAFGSGTAVVGDSGAVVTVEATLTAGVPGAVYHPDILPAPAPGKIRRVLVGTEAGVSLYGVGIGLAPGGWYRADCGLSDVYDAADAAAMWAAWDAIIDAAPANLTERADSAASIVWRSPERARISGETVERIARQMDRPTTYAKRVDIVLCLMASNGAVGTGPIFTTEAAPGSRMLGEAGTLVPCVPPMPRTTAAGGDDIWGYAGNDGENMVPSMMNALHETYRSLRGRNPSTVAVMVAQGGMTRVQITPPSGDVWKQLRARLGDAVRQIRKEGGTPYVSAVVWFGATEGDVTGDNDGWSDPAHYLTFIETLQSDVATLAEQTTGQSAVTDAPVIVTYQSSEFTLDVTSSPTPQAVLDHALEHPDTHAVTGPTYPFRRDVPADDVHGDSHSKVMDGVVHGRALGLLLAGRWPDPLRFSAAWDFFTAMDDPARIIVQYNRPIAIDDGWITDPDGGAIPRPLGFEFGVDAGAVPTLSVVDQSPGLLAQGRIVLGLDVTRDALAATASEAYVRYAWSIDAVGSDHVGPERGARGLIYAPVPTLNAAGALTRDWAVTQEVALDPASPPAQDY